LVAAILEDGLAKVEDGAEEDMCKYMYKQLQGNGQHKPQQGKATRIMVSIKRTRYNSLTSGLEVKGRSVKKTKANKSRQINRSTTAELAEGSGGGLPYTYELRSKVS
jgi:hypothetical protein